MELTESELETQLKHEKYQWDAYGCGIPEIDLTPHEPEFDYEPTEPDYTT